MERDESVSVGTLLCFFYIKSLFSASAFQLPLTWHHPPCLVATRARRHATPREEVHKRCICHGFDERAYVHEVKREPWTRTGTRCTLW